MLAHTRRAFRPRVTTAARHSAESAGSRLHPDTHSPLIQRSQIGLTVLFRHGRSTYQGNELTRNSSWNASPQSSQFAEPPWVDTRLKSGIGARELIPASKKKKKKPHAGNVSPILTQNPCMREHSHHYHRVVSRGNKSQRVRYKFLRL